MDFQDAIQAHAVWKVKYRHICAKATALRVRSKSRARQLIDAYVTRD